ncbi:P-loop containing nucleoside triphosphate hydrolase protein, partial [Mycena metata]
LALLPSEPKIFYGRDVEVSAILDVFAQEAPRIAILGTGGMGKTTLAKVILHSSEITARFGQHRFFVACDTASAGIDLATIIQTHLCLNSGRDSTGMVLKFFRDGPPCLLVIDNLESVWEPAMGRNKTENLLCLLADVEHLTLMVTMRGAERPGKVRWTRPFLKPLSPLPQDAARHTFLAITDEDFDFSDIDKVLNVTGNIPLVIELISHVVEVEGLHNTLSRWKMETTSLVSEGHDHTSNLDLSISLSLSSPRIERHPQARELLGLLAVLPDGLSEADLQHSKLPLVEVLGCKSALLQTSLAYSDEQGRLRVLAPIGEHMRKYHP